MPNGGDLYGLRLPAGEGSMQLVGGPTAKSVQAVPERHRAPLIGYIAQHGAERAVPDLPEVLAAELEIVALLTSSGDPPALPGRQ
jgi:hypothetical protein